jgi:hypothetical protein
VDGIGGFVQHGEGFIICIGVEKVARTVAGISAAKRMWR